MSSDSSKNKGKRSRSSSEANNSFVKNVTSRVSGLLPTTITKWFSSPSSSNANGSATTADSTDSSTEDEAPENTATTPPPSKRMRYSSPTGKFNHFNPAENNSATTSIDTPEPCSPYSTVQSPPGRNTFRRETNFVSTPIHSSNKEIIIDRSERDSNMFKSQPSIAAAGQSISSKRKSIFDSTNKESSIKPANTSSNAVKAPYFKPTLLGSPFYPGRTIYGGAAISYMNEPNIKQRTVTHVKEAKSSENSTMSNSTRRIMYLLEEYSSPLAEAKRIQQYIGNSSNTSILPYTSKTASYKTRELLVPSVASIFRLRQKSRLMDTTNAARQIIASHSSAYNPTAVKKQSDAKSERPEYESLRAASKMKTHLTRNNRGKDLEEPSIPLNLPNAVLTIDQNNLPKFSFDLIATSTPISKTISKPTFPQTTATVTKSTDTLKAKTASEDQSFRFTSPVRISSDIATNCTTPPRFTFGSPERSIDKSKADGKNGSTSKVEDTVKSDKVTSSSKDWQCNDCWVNNKAGSDKCICCGGKKPVMLDMSDKCSVCKHTHSQPTIDKCIRCVGSQTRDVNKTSTPKSIDVSTWKCEDCWVGNTISDAKCVCCGAKNPNKTAQEDAPKLATEATDKDWKCQDCCVSNLISNKKCICCGAKNPHKSEADAPQLATKAIEKDWKCEDCWVNNLISDAKCICCGAKRSCEKIPKPATKAVEKEWKCKDCWVYNHSCLAECMDCGGARHRSNETSSTVVSNNNIFQSNTSFKPVDKSCNNIVKTKTDMWECSSCLVKNESNKSKCVCCETDRDGAKQIPQSKYNFNFGVNTNNTFKFGIDSNAKQESSLTNQIDSKPDQESQPKIEESETNNNVLEKTPSFTFTSPVKKNTDQVDAIKGTTVSSPPKMNFTFGMPNQLPNDKLDSTKNVNAENEKPQAVPKIDFATVTKDNLKPLGNMFNSPVSKGSTTSSPLLSAGNNNENKETASKSLLQPSVAVTTVTPIQSTFSFATGGIKAKQNLFEAPSSTAAVPSVSFMLSQQSSPVKSAVASPTPVKSLFQKPETATTSGLPVFQRSSPINTSSVSLFQKSDASSTAVPPPAAKAPIFSFGNNLSSTAPPPVTAEKPKFNFTFGSTNKPEALSMFKPATFGAESAGTPNKFTLTSGDGIGANNSVSGNSLSSSVGLSTGNTLISGKGLSTSSSLRGNNELPTDTLAGGSGLPSGSAMPNTPGLIFGGSIPKENLWSSNNNASTNLFASNSTTATHSLQKPSAFTFGSSAPFNANNSATPAFGSNTQSATATPAFGSNTLSATVAPAFGSNTQSATVAPAFGSNTQSATVAPAFGSNTQSATATSAFGSNTQSATAPPAFGSNTQSATGPPAFGSNTQSATGPPAFGSNTQSATAPPAFSSNTQSATAAPAFGSNTQAAQVVFGMSSQNNNNSVSLFSSAARNQTAPSNMFGAAQPPSNDVPTMGMFGTPNVGTAPTFGTPNQSIPSFEAPSLTPAQAPAFNFGSPQAGVFGFGQHQQQAQQQQPQQQRQQQQQQQPGPQAGVYSFGGGAPVGSPHVQFNMGSAPNTTMRRVRKAVRRNPPR